MTTRTNTAKWTGTRWRIDVQKDGTRKSFYSSTPGRTCLLYTSPSPRDA